MVRWGFILAIICGLLPCGLAGGCSRPAHQQEPLRAEVARLMSLPGAIGTSHLQLQQELARLSQQQQLPEQLIALLGPKNLDDQPYAAFIKAYPALTRSALRHEIQTVWPARALRLEPGQLQRARELLAQQGAARARFSQAVATLGGQPQLSVADALAADDEWCEAILTGCRLEALAAAEVLAEQQPAEAARHFQSLLFVAEQLSRERNLNARLAAATIRADAFQVLAAVANHPAVTGATLQQLQRLMAQHTANWPADEQSLVADQAHGLLIFELVRNGRFESLIGKDAWKDLERKGIGRTTATAAVRDVDLDELFYVRAMQQQITSANRPYLERLPVLEALSHELEERRGTGDYPLVSGELLLAGLGDVHRTLTEDRCRCEAWLIALSAANNQPLATLPPCPLTGQPYQLTQDRQRVTVTGCELRCGTKFEINRPGAVQARRRAAGFEFSSEVIR